MPLPRDVIILFCQGPKRHTAVDNRSRAYLPQVDCLRPYSVHISGKNVPGEETGGERTMSFTYLDHDADIGIRCEGGNRREAFAEGAMALLSLMADVEKVRSELTFRIECRAPGLDTLFVEFLNEIISLMGRREVVFAGVRIDGIEGDDNEYYLKGRLIGEGIDPTRHGLKTEVKAATYFGLEAVEEENRVTLQCVLDI